jgi:lipopolysaccharide transport system ATP-binding protein
MPGTVISVENLSKSYRLGVIGTGTFRGDIHRWWAKQRGKPDPSQIIGQADHGNRQGETLWALKDIDFTVQQGEALGIIGRNGAGKSTLLKILSRVTAPTSGVVKVKGRIASLLEVGTGFHPELTGRENIYLNGAIMGMSHAEVGRKFDEIVDFSGVEKFIDTPVKRYSSGMYVRLAFAVAAHLEPEILIVDEVLAVGDAEFQKKCLGKMSDVAHEGRTVLFVSHNMGAITKLCTRVFLLQSGHIVAEGNTSNVISIYQSSSRSHLGSISFESVQSEAYFTKASILNAEQQVSADISITDSFTIQFEYVVTEKLRNLDVTFILWDKNGTKIFTCSLSDVDHKYFTVHPAGNFVARVTIPAEFLTPGLYSITPAIHEFNRKIYDQKDHAIQFRIVETGSVRYKMLGVDTGAILVKFEWNIRSN